MKAGIYCRLSSQRSEEEGPSLETQKEMCIQAATRAGDQIHSHCIWLDTGSSDSATPPTLQQMLEAVKNRKVDIVYVYSPDRLGRDPSNVLLIWQELTKAGVRLEFVVSSNTTDMHQR